MYKSIEQQLDKIFKKWYERMYPGKSYLVNDKDKEPFTKDGIMFNENIPADEIENKWEHSSRRILFLLKDQNQKGDIKWPEDIRYWFKRTEIDDDKSIAQKNKNMNLQDPFFQKLAFMLWGFSKIDKNNDWWPVEVEMHFKEVKEFFNTQPYALIECKKLPGGGKVYDSEIKKHINGYGDLLKLEIETLNPNIIICMSGPGHHFALNDLFNKEELENCSNNVHIYRKNGKEILIIFSYHPSHPDYNYGKLMDNCRSFIQNNFSAEAIR